MEILNTNNTHNIIIQITNIYQQTSNNDKRHTTNQNSRNNRTNKINNKHINTNDYSVFVVSYI